MTKKRRTVSLSAENDEFLKNHDNASALVNRLVEKYRKGGGREDIIQQYRLQEARTELDELQSRLEIKQDLVTELEQSVETSEDKRERLIKEASETLVSTDPENEAVQHWAEKIGIPPEELVEEIE